MESELWVTLYSIPHSHHLAAVATATRYLLANIPSLHECVCGKCAALWGALMACLRELGVCFTQRLASLALSPRQVLPASASHARPPALARGGSRGSGVADSSPSFLRPLACLFGLCLPSTHTMLTLPPSNTMKASQSGRKLPGQNHPDFSRVRWGGLTAFLRKMT